MPSPARAADVRGDVESAELFAVEEAEISRAVDGRRREFVAGRACARAALERLGVPRQAIPVGDGGAPRWPAGIVGSITHCRGYRGAAVAHADDLAALGVDAEPNAPLPGRVLGAIAAPRERARLADLAGEGPGVCWDRLLFSIKESVYKVWFPLTGRRLGFGDVDVSIQPDGRFRADLRSADREPAGEVAKGLAGRWRVSSGIVLSAVALAAGGWSDR